VLVVAVAATLLAAAGAQLAGAAARRTHTTPADRAATHDYLAADLARAQVLLASLPARIAAYEAAAARIGSECPGVLAGEPPEGPPGPQQERQTPRQEGEATRRRVQRESLTRELEVAIAPPITAADKEAEAAFVAASRPLRWSDPAINKGVQNYLALVESLPTPKPAPNVCADMRAWVASGYRSLSPATRALQAAQEAEPPPPLPRGPIVAPSAIVLRPFEGAAEKQLLHQIRAVREQEFVIARPLSGVQERVEAALGIQNPFAEVFTPRPVKGTVTIGSGRTAAGESFVVRVEPASGGESCRLQIARRGERGEGGLGIDGGTPCRFSGAREAGPSVNCNEGLLTISSFVRAATRRVRLNLSDGSEITSKALLVPRRLGGPAAFYYQVVRGPSPIPVSLTELDAHGRTLGVVHLPAIVECTKHPLKFLPGGIRTLVRDRVPGGVRFTIEAQHYRFLGHVYLDLKLNDVESEGSERGSAVSLRFTSGASASPTFASPRVQGIFSPEESTGCHPTPYEIVFGILKRPRDRVLARTSAGLVPLKEVALPRSLHTPGVLAYGIFLPPPSELLLRDAAGRTLAHESESETSRATVERCEGEAEGP
jgi:hypothetical protein